MKKSIQTILFLLVLLTSTLSLSAQRVTKDAATQKAMAFLTQLNRKAAAARSTISKTPQLVLANNSDELYVFNDKANGGYVVISGEERMPDVLAYSYDGLFDEDGMPCNMQAWLDNYAEQVKYLRTHPEANMKKKSLAERRNIGPLLTCWFHQGTPYNNNCPEVDGKRCVTGCVATAMAQIMYYWQWPKQTTNVIPGYTTYELKIDMPDIPVTTIDWDNMLGQYYGNNYTEEQADAISTLMLLCGTSAKIEYRSDGSGASTNDAAYAFRHYFGYDDLLEEFYRHAYDSEIWEQMIYDELNDGRPVLYSGCYEDGYGHAFVVDGYENNFFHVNWGWGGAVAYVLMTDAEGWEGFFHHQDAIVGIQPAYADNPSRYAVIDNGKMTLYYDKEKDYRSGTILPHRDNWSDYAEEVTECVIDPSFANLKQNSLSFFFRGLKKMKSIEGLKYLNSSKVCDMQSMFEGCSSLTSLDVSGFKTDKVTSMQLMFSNCSSLTNLDVSGFNTENVRDMHCMFWDCSSLPSLDVSGFKTDNVMYMSNMFSDCSGLTSLDVSGFKTDNVTSMSSMFSGCSGLTSLDVTGFKTDNVTDMGSMFYGCKGLISLDVSGFKTDNVMYMSSMFSDCSGLTSLDVSGFKTDNVTSMSSMFSGCSSLTNLDVSGFNPENVKNMNWMFAGCPSLTNLDVKGFKTDNVTDMGGMFYGCSSLPSLDVSGFNTQNVTEMEWMFYGCNQLATVYASERWDMSNVEKTDGMFSACYSIVGGKGTTFDANHTDGEYARIDGGPSNPGYLTLKGDANGDGEVNVADVDYVIERIGEDYETNKAADVNGDGEINVADVDFIIEQII